MTANLPVATTAPFDAIRITTLEGREYWSARDLMPLLGYDSWRRFADAVQRAKIAAHNSGHDVTSLFAGAVKKSDGRPAEDYHLARYACYLVAMNGDPRKQEIADAQTYFAIKTREAETAPRQQSAVMPTHSEALRGWAAEIEAREIAEAERDELGMYAASLESPAAAWTELADAQGDYGVADAAKVLSRHPNISTGERRLFQTMRANMWVYRSGDRWRAYQSQVDNGRLVEKLGRPYLRNGEKCLGDPTVRITPKGLEALQKILGGGSQQLALAVAE